MSGLEKPVLLGTHIYPAAAAAADRMRRALDTWANLSGVRLVNLQFRDDPAPLTHEAFETRSVLRRDSVTVTGIDGARKPVVRELFDQLVEACEEANCAYAGFSNADIMISPAAIQRVAQGGRDAVVFSRMDIDPVDGTPLGEFFSGQDTFFIRPDVYRKLRRRFRPYVIGEMPWDVIYSSILLVHAGAELVNRGDDCRHVFHETIWVNSPFASHAWRLARQDWTYFARWYRYYNGAKAIREAGRPAAEEDTLRKQVFGHPLTGLERGKNVFRRLRYGWLEAARCD